MALLRFACCLVFRSCDIPAKSAAGTKRFGILLSTDFISTTTRSPLWLAAATSEITVLTFLRSRTGKNRLGHNFAHRGFGKSMRPCRCSVLSCRDSRPFVRLLFIHQRSSLTAFTALFASSKCSRSVGRDFSAQLLTSGLLPFLASVSKRAIAFLWPATMSFA